MNHLGENSLSIILEYLENQLVDYYNLLNWEDWLTWGVTSMPLYCN